MSLFVGGLDRKVALGDLRVTTSGMLCISPRAEVDGGMQDKFEPIGELRRCELKGSHAFVDYLHDQDAKRAIEKLDGTSISGFRMNVMWSKLSPNFNAATCGLLISPPHPPPPLVGHECVCSSVWCCRLYADHGIVTGSGRQTTLPTDDRRTETENSRATTVTEARV
jgi:hypothetical protein